MLLLAVPLKVHLTPTFSEGRQATLQGLAVPFHLLFVKKGLSALALDSSPLRTFRKVQDLGHAPDQWNRNPCGGMENKADMCFKALQLLQWADKVNTAAESHSPRERRCIEKANQNISTAVYIYFFPEVLFFKRDTAFLLLRNTHFIQ